MASHEKTECKKNEAVVAGGVEENCYFFIMSHQDRKQKRSYTAATVSMCFNLYH